MVLILVTGSTASGKSTISSIVSKLEKCIIIPQDSFYKHDFVDFPYKPGMDDRMERPDSINWGGLLDIVNKNSTISNVIEEGHCILSNKKSRTVNSAISTHHPPINSCISIEPTYE
jgi:cytidylate kinase